MKTAETIITYLFGLIFLVFGLNHFFQFLPMPELEGHALGFMVAIGSTGYMTAVKVLELVVALMLIANIQRPLAWLLILPVTVNIMMYDVFLVGMVSPPAGLVFVLNVFMVYRLREKYACLISN